VADLERLTADQADALASAGATAAMHLEIKNPLLLRYVEASLPPAVVSLALLMVETDAEYSRRWIAAGTDWMVRGQLLHEVILYLLTPAATVISEAEIRHERLLEGLR
jgi:hypothetical protein